jgi:hypothetical protein
VCGGDVLAELDFLRRVEVRKDRGTSDRANSSSRMK